MNVPRFQRILVPVTLAEGSRAALALAVGLAQVCAGKILVLHALQPNPDGDALREGPAAERKLAELAGEFCDAQVPIATCVSEGNSARLIVEKAKAFCADLIVMATRRPGGLLHWLHRNTAGHVFEHAPCPVWGLSLGKDRNTALLMLRGAPTAAGEVEEHAAGSIVGARSVPPAEPNDPVRIPAAPAGHGWP